MALTFQNMETPKTEGSWQEWSVPTVDSLSLDSIGRTDFFRLTKANHPGEIFSSQSTLGAEISPPTSSQIHQVDPEVQPWQISIFVMLVLGYYIYTTFSNLNILPSILRASGSVTKTISLYESRNNNETRFTIHSSLLVILSVTTVAISMAFSTVRQSPMLSIGIIMAAITIIFVYKYTLVSIISKFSSNKLPFSNLAKINSHALTITAVIYTPVAITTIITPSDNDAALLILLILWIYYSLRLFKLFIISGFGKLQWILYLCAIEILPVSYLVTIAVRY